MSALDSPTGETEAAHSAEGRRAAHAARAPGREDDLEGATDDELLVLVHRGSPAAFAELYRRHLSDARRYARRLARRHLHRDGGEDVLAEAVRRVLSALEHGRGPVIGFRQYLFTAIRTVAISQGAIADREDLVDIVPDEICPAPDDRLDAELAIEAFASLPRHWREVLWTSSIDDVAHSTIASRFGVSARSVAMRANRAREALRIAYVRAHLADSPSRSCRNATDLLARRAVAPLSARQARVLTKHLAGCADCRRAESQIHTEIDSVSRAIGPAAATEIFRLDDVQAPV